MRYDSTAECTRSFAFLVCDELEALRASDFAQRRQIPFGDCSTASIYDALSMPSALSALAGANRRSFGTAAHSSEPRLHRRIFDSWMMAHLRKPLSPGGLVGLGISDSYSSFHGGVF